MTDPKLIMFDEPSLGLAPVIVDDIFDIIVRINKERHIPVLLVEQNAFMALSISNRTYVLENGFIKTGGDIHFGNIVLEGHHPVFVGDTAALAVIILAEAVPRIPHIALIRKAAVFVHRHIPAAGLIVDVVLQVLRHLHDLQLINVIAPKIVI